MTHADVIVSIIFILSMLFSGHDGEDHDWPPEV